MVAPLVDVHDFTNPCNTVSKQTWKKKTPWEKELVPVPESKSDSWREQVLVRENKRVHHSLRERSLKTESSKCITGSNPNTG